jgi:hypothetical protein
MAAKQRAGELEELKRTDPDEYLRQAKFADIMKEAKTFEALQAIARARGYHHGWAKRMWEFKRGRSERSVGGHVGD